MTSWTKDELNKIEHADELRISPLGNDNTAGDPTTIWVVREGDDLHVRAYRGRGGAGFPAAPAPPTGPNTTGGGGNDRKIVEVD
ncbi:DUF2255 family protein, partial [Streptomyces niveus]|uniref:DUF2255 family protein n=1 Tax=Streptomyces niveus TaxID=193462 RepID=UPI0036D956BD